MMKKQLITLIAILLPIMANADISGKCGDDLIWAYEESDQTLTISGTGSMYNYFSYDNKAPWYGNYDYYLVNKIKSIVIESGVNSIGNSAFYFCTALETIKIPESVISIGAYAFQNCSSLTSINIPERVNSIGQFAFSECKKLASINIPSSVNDIGEGAFQLTAWYDNQPDGLVYAGKVAYQYKGTMPEHTSIELLDGTLSISTSAFRGCTGLTTITMPESLTSIGVGAFSGCNTLSDFNIPNSVTYLGSKAFENTAWYDNQPNGLVYAGNFLYTYKGNMPEGESISIEEGTIGIVSSAFSECEGLTSLIIPNNVKYIGKLAFGICTNLSDLVFQDGETSLTIREDSYASAFSQCPIGNVYLGRNIINNSYNYIYSSLGSISTPFNLTISKYVTELEGGTFANCEKIKTLKFEEGSDTLTLINDHNAYNAIMPFASTPIDSIYMGRIIVGKDLYYPERVITPLANVGSSFVMRVGDNITEIGNRAFSGWMVSSLIIPNNVLKIGLDAFSNCTSLSSVSIENGNTALDFVEGSGFSGCQLQNLYLGRNLTYDSWMSPFRYNKEALTSLTIGEQVTEIGECQFVGLKSLKTLEFPNSLKKIGTQAFYGCEGLTSVSIPSSVMEIGEDAFGLTRGLTSFTIEDGTEELSINNNFLNSPLNEVYMGRNISYPEGISPFSLLESLKVLKIGKDVSSINDGAFAGCQNLKDVVSYAVIVPATGQNVFTESYLYDATLHVLDYTYDDYSKAYPWCMFKNFMLIDPDGNETLISSSIGDADGDGEIDIADIVTMIDYILGKPTTNFILLSADLNSDSEVDVFDVMKAINLVASQKRSARQSARATRSTEDMAIISVTPYGVVLGINDVRRFTAFQFDVVVADDVELTDVRLTDDTVNHTLRFIKNGQNSYRVIGVSLNNSVLTANGNNLVELTLSKAGNVYIDNIIFVTPQETKVYFASGEAVLTGIDSIEDEQVENVFDLSGRKVNVDRSSLPKGIYIINNKKVVVK